MGFVKKYRGNKKDLDNYWGILLSSVVGTCFAKLLTAGITEVAESREWLLEEQAAIRQKRETTDHLFCPELDYGEVAMTEDGAISHFCGPEEGLRYVGKGDSMGEAAK